MNEGKLEVGTTLEKLRGEAFALEYANLYQMEIEKLGGRHIGKKRARALRQRVRNKLSTKYPEEVRLVNRYADYLSSVQGDSSGTLTQELMSNMPAEEQAGWAISRMAGSATKKLRSQLPQEEQSMNGTEPQAPQTEVKKRGWNEKAAVTRRARRVADPYQAVSYLAETLGYLPDTLTMAKLMNMEQAEVVKLLVRLDEQWERRVVDIDPDYSIFSFTRKRTPREIVMERINTMSPEDLQTLADLLKGNK